MTDARPGHAAPTRAPASPTPVPGSAAPTSGPAALPPPAAAAARAAPPGRPATAARPAPVAALPSRDELTIAWGDGVLRGFSPKAKVFLQSGRFVGVDPDAAVFALPNKQWRPAARMPRGEAEAALASRFGRPVPLKLVVDSAEAAPTVEADGTEDFDDDLHHLQDANVEVISPEQRLMDAFPGAEEVST